DKERADALATELEALKADKAKADADLVAAKAAADEAVKADRDRRTAIMALDEAKGREALAEHLYATGLSVEQAKATLAVAPAAGPNPPVVEPATYEQQRLAGAALNQPIVAPDEAKAGWSKAIARVNAGFQERQ